jgi:asparagine synthase (glutamine-hydrolysing)
MCGIAGFVHQKKCADEAALLTRMTARLTHRGPDASGQWPLDPGANSPAWLGHRRLSIIDLAGGVQPMSNETGDLWLTYNGEIFNHADLRPELERAGHRYASRSDTEMILHAWEEYGPKSLDRFRGMFAYAMWDTRKQELICVRDRLGIKPLYYFCDGEHFVFASEIKALLEHPAVSARPDTATLCEYLALGFLSDPGATMFDGIHALPAGCWMRLRANPGQPLTPEIFPYWDAPKPQRESACTETEAIEETYRRFEETVRMRLMSDVPLGVFLSGGVDSSAIAAMTRRITGGPLKTFSVGYSEEKYSELGWAGQVARHVGSEHFEVRVNAREFFCALPSLVWQEDEPIAWPSSVALYFVSRLAAQQVKVVLTGEGSDEIFAGYARYQHYLNFDRQAQVWEKSPEFLRLALRRQIAGSRLLNASMRRKLGHTVLARPSGFSSLYLENFLSAFTRPELARLIGDGDPYVAYRRHYDSYPDGPPLQRLLYADQKTYLAELLRKQDRMSMACSIESRVPMLDHTFVEFAAGLPANLKMHGGAAKYVFKRAVERLLPREIVYREKMGFPTPVGPWLSGEYRERVADLLSGPASFCRQVLHAEGIEDVLALARSGQHDTTDRIWRLLTLELWGRRFFLNQAPSLEQ